MRVDTQVIKDFRLTALAGHFWMKCQPPASTTLAERACPWGSHWGTSERKVLPRVEIVPLQPFLEARNPGCRVASVEGGLSMHAHATSPHYQELERLGDEIAELSAHLDAATARLLDLIRESTAAAAGTRASAPAPPGSPGGWARVLGAR